MTVGDSTLRGNRVLFGSVYVHAVAEFAAWITVLVVAFDRGGSSAAGLAVVVQLVPAALLAPLITSAGDRFARHHVLIVAFTVQACAAAGLAAGLLADAPLAAIYALASVFTIASVAAPAAVASLLVHHASTPNQLVQWNITKSLVRAAGSLTGPLMAALVLAISTPAVVFAVLSIMLAASALMTGVWLPPDDRLPSALTIGGVFGDATNGVVYVATHTASRRIVVFIGFIELLLGALDLVFVAVAFDRLGRDGSAVALIAVAFAAGTLLAGAVASRHPSQRLSRALWVGSMMLTLPLLAIVGDVTSLAVVLALAATLGAGNGLIEIAAHTLLQRSCTESMTSRVYGVLDSTAMVAAALGAAVAGRLIDSGDLDTTVLVLGLGGATVLVGAALRLRPIEQGLQTADPETIACLRAVSFLDPLPQPTLDRLALRSPRRTVAAGEPVTVEGEPGDEFFVLVTGSVAITVGDAPARHLSAPASFGEVALLRDGHRTASVTATEASVVLVVGRLEFLDAIGRTATSHRLAQGVVHEHVGTPDPG